MKDFYDIWMLSRTFDFKGEILAEAIEKTFKNRKTPITADPTVFKPYFLGHEDKRVQWLGFMKKAKLKTSESFVEIATAVKTFLEPVLIALANQQPFQNIWKSPGPWK
jgi:hypothetical protein